MKMNSYRRSKRTSSLWGVVALVVAIGLLFAVDRFSHGIISSNVRSGAGAALSLVASAGSSMRESGTLSTRASLARENEELRREIALHAEQIAQAEFLRDENTALHQMARLADEQPGVTARVLSSFETTPYGTFLIDAGEVDGVQQGAVVLTPGGFVLGRVTNVSRSDATVEALFAPGEMINLVSGDETFTAEGQGGGNARAEVPRESKLSLGDALVAPEFGDRNAGTIMHIESASSSATSILSIRIPVNLDALRFVYVAAR